MPHPTDPELQVEVLRRQIEELRRDQIEMRARFEQAASAGGVGVWDWDLEHGRVYLDPTLKALLGWAGHEFPDTVEAWRARIHPDDLAQWDATLQSVIDSPRDSYVRRYRVLDRNNNVVWLETRGRILRDGDGRAIRICGVDTDVTSREHAREARDILEAQLHSAHKLEAIGTLAGGVAHDFNNILASVLGNVQIALDKERSGESVHDNLDEILKAGVRGRDIVRQLLAFSRAEDGQREVGPIRMAVEEAVRFVRPFIPSSVRITTALRDDALVDMELPRIHQLLLNLCTNARDAMPEGGDVTITLQCVEESRPFQAGHHELPAGEYAVLSVEDDGVGIPPDVRPRVFEPFFTTKPPGKAVGLGLAMVYGIATDHGGDVLLESGPGEGTRIRIWFPVSHGERRADEVTLPPAKGQGRVLLVDDEESVVRVAVSMLESLGYEVVSFEQAEAALAAFEREPQAYDVIVTDQTMPGITGLTLARRAHEIRDDVPVLLCTGFSESVSVECQEDGAVAAVLMKPFLVEELGAALAGVRGEGART